MVPGLPCIISAENRGFRYHGKKSEVASENYIMSMTIGHAVVPASLPLVLTPVLGRDCESTSLRNVLADADHQLVTILGPGGVGKTRLAIHVAQMEADAGREVVFISVAAMRDPALVLQAIGYAAGSSGEAPEDVLPWVIETVQDRELLLVLDNLEQVLAVGPALTVLLGQCPLLTILATSRAPLGIDGEERFALAPLDLPDDSATAEEILEADAVALFVNRARAANPSLSLDGHASTIGAICRRLDGLPLAIELAAARSSILPPEALLVRLSGQLQVLGGMRQDVPDRQRTMRETIAWSYELLTPDEQKLFRHLGVFGGGFGADAVAFVGEVLGVADSGVVLRTLIDQSLVREGAGPDAETRYQLLETVRSYALEELKATGETDVAFLAMLEYLQELVGRAEPHLRGGDQFSWLNRLDAESVNLRTAVGWALEHGHEETVFRIISDAYDFIQDRGLVREARNWLGRALEASGGRMSPFRARALTTAGYLAGSVSDIQTARARFEEALQLAMAIGDRLEECRALIGLGRVAIPRADFDTAETLLRQAMPIAREIGHQHELVMSLNGLGVVCGDTGRPEEAIRYLEEGRSLLAGTGDRLLDARMAMNLGFIYLGLGDFDRGELVVLEALGIQRKLNARGQLGVSLVNWAGLALHKGDIAGAHDAYLEAIELFRERGNRAYEGGALTGFANVAVAQEDYAEAARRHLEANRLLANTGDQKQLVENAETLAGVCVAVGHAESAVALLAAASHLREKSDAPNDNAQRQELEKLAASAREALGAGRFEELWQAGSLPDIDALARRVSTIAREVIGKEQESPAVTAVETGSGAVDAAPILTVREVEILRFLAEGTSTNEIAEKLDVRPRTVATHVANILAKLEVPSRTAAVAWALRAGIV